MATRKKGLGAASGVVDNRVPYDIENLEWVREFDTDTFAGVTSGLGKLGSSEDGNYVFGTTNNKGGSQDVRVYALAGPWDASSMTIESGPQVFPTSENIEGGLIRSDGLKIMGGINENTIDDNRVNQYDLSSAFDITTESIATVRTLFGGTGYIKSLAGLHYDVAAKKVFVFDGQANDWNVAQILLSTDWSLTGATVQYYRTFARGSFPIDGNLSGIALTPDGETLFLLEKDSFRVQSYTLSTPFDISTKTYDGISVNIGALVTAGGGSSISQSSSLIWSDDGFTLLIATGRRYLTQFQVVEAP